MDDHNIKTRLKNLDIPPPEAKAQKRAAFIEAVSQSDEANCVSSDEVMRHHQQNAFSDHHQKPTKKGLSSMKKRILLAIAAVLVFAGAAFAQTIYDFIVRDDSDTRTIEIFYSPDDGDSDTDASVPEPVTDDDPEDVIAQVPYDVHLPTDLPDGYALSNAEYYDHAQYLSVEYRCGTRWGFMVVQRPMTEERLDNLPPQNVGASADIIDVDLNGAVGQYVQGRWVPQRRTPLSEDEPRAEVTTVWENDLPHHRLIWVQDGRFFSVSTSAGSFNPDVNQPCPVTTDDILAIGRSMTD